MELTQQNIISYASWMEWDVIDDSYTWCIEYLIQRWIEWEEGFNTQESTHTWLFS